MRLFHCVLCFGAVVVVVFFFLVVSSCILYCFICVWWWWCCCCRLFHSGQTLGQSVIAFVVNDVRSLGRRLLFLCRFMRIYWGIKEAADLYWNQLNNHNHQFWLVWTFHTQKIHSMNLHEFSIGIGARVCV